MVKLVKSTEQPYASTLKVIKSIKNVPSLFNFKELIKYAWSKVGKEAERYWQGEIPADKLVVSEDAKLMIISYLLVQSGCKRIFSLLIALQDFVNDKIYEECAPLATFESAIRVIEYELRERIVNNTEFNISVLENTPGHNKAEHFEEFPKIRVTTNKRENEDAHFRFSKLNTSNRYSYS
jgi:hypothetical protein